MNNGLAFLIKIYGFLLRLYPAKFRADFEEQMLQDFSDFLDDADQKGRFAVLQFCMRELVDFPMSLLHAHWKENGMSKLLRAEPVVMGLRSALSFGLGFAVVSISTWQISFWLIRTSDPWIQHWSVWYYDTFRSEHGMFFFQRIVLLISTILTGLIFGLVFALFFSNRSNYLRYMLIGTLGFLISHGVSFVLWEIFAWSFDLSLSQSYLLTISLFIFTGAVWGALCTLLDRFPSTLLHYLVVGMILYPLSTYIFLKPVFAFQLESTPWFFASLMIFMLVVISSVFVFVIRNNGRIPWMVIIAAIAYPTLYYGFSYVAYNIFRLPTSPIGTAISPADLMIYQLNSMMVEAVIGTVFGLMVGVLWGYQRKHNQLLTAAEH